MAEDKTLRLILGIILVLIALPGLGMMSMMSYPIAYGMMGAYGFGMFYITGYIVTIGLLVLGIYLIYNGLKKK